MSIPEKFRTRRCDQSHEGKPCRHEHVLEFDYRGEVLTRVYEASASGQIAASLAVLEGTSLWMGEPERTRRRLEFKRAFLYGYLSGGDLGGSGADLSDLPTWDQVAREKLGPEHPLTSDQLAALTDGIEV